VDLYFRAAENWGDDRRKRKGGATEGIEGTKGMKTENGNKSRKTFRHPHKNESGKKLL
jgi:hypothetical protein